MGNPLKIGGNGPPGESGNRSNIVVIVVAVVEAADTGKEHKMMWTHEEIMNGEKIFRLNLINSITGIKPANLIGTRSAGGESNLAVFSSVVHIGSNPALIGFFLRPDENVRRHTWENIRDTGYYTINHLPAERAADGHQTSAKYPRGDSEFARCNFTEKYVEDFPAPAVAEAVVQFGLHLESFIPIPLNGTQLVIGAIQWLSVPDELISPEGYIDMEAADSAGISGLNSYYRFTKIGDFPYARPD